GTEGVKIVRPRLHHLAAFGKPLCLVVSRTNFISLGVRQLQLDHVRREALLIEQRAGHAAKAVPGLLFAAVAQSSQRGIDRVLRHRSIAGAKRWEQVTPSPRQWFELAQNR